MEYHDKIMGDISAILTLSLDASPGLSPLRGSTTLMHSHHLSQSNRFAAIYGLRESELSFFNPLLDCTQAEGTSSPARWALYETLEQRPVR